MLFLTRERLEIGEPVLTAADVQMMLVHYLPRRDRTPEDLDRPPPQTLQTARTTLSR
jgi:hypothetical protein